jgi:hypothetical protein
LFPVGRVADLFKPWIGLSGGVNVRSELRVLPATTDGVAGSAAWLRADALSGIEDTKELSVGFRYQRRRPLAAGD